MILRQTGGEKVQIELGVRGTIQCLAYNKQTRCLAVGVGSDVYVIREVQQSLCSRCYRIRTVTLIVLCRSLRGSFNVSPTSGKHALA